MATNENNLIVNLLARDKMSKPIKRVQSSVIRFVGAISASLAAFKAISFPITQAIDFDRAMKDVQKTTGFVDVQIQKLSADLNQLATDLSVSQQELAQIAAVGGQLGIGQFGVEAVRQFTESVARAKVTLGLTAEQASELGAQLVNIFNIDITQIENIFASINELTNNSVANAQDLGDIMRRIGNIAGLTLQEVGALSAYLRDLGVSVEVAGTSMVKTFTNMSTKAKEFSDVMGVSTEEWVDLLSTNALDALKAVLARINEMDAISKASTIKDLFGGGRLFSTLSKLASGANDEFERLNELLEKSNTGFSFGTSSINEYNNILRSVKEQFILVGNAFRKIGIEIGTTLLPDLEKLAKAMQVFLKGAGRDILLELGKGLSSLSKSIEETISSIVDSNVAWGEFLDKVKLVLTFIAAFLAFEIAAHLAYMVKQAFSFGNALKNTVKHIGKVTNSFSRLSSAAAAAAASEIASVSKVTEAYRRRLALHDKLLQKFKKDQLSYANAERVAKGKVSSQSVVDKSAEFSKKQQKAIADLTKAKARSVQLEIDDWKRYQAFEKGRFDARAKEIAKLAAIENKTHSQRMYQAALERANGEMHTKFLKKARAEISRNSSRLKGYNLIIARNTKVLKSNVAQMVRASGVSARLTGVVTKMSIALPRATTGFIFLGRALTKLGKAAKSVYTFFGGWIGILLEVATAVYIFWDDIKGAFAGESAKVAEATARSAREEMRRLQEEATSAIASLEQFSKQAADTVANNLRQAFAGDNLNDFSLAANKVAAALGETANSVIGTQVRLEQYDQSIAGTKRRMLDLSEEIDKARKRIEYLQNHLNMFGTGDSSVKDALVRDIAAANLEIERLTKRYDEATKRAKALGIAQEKMLNKNIKATAALRNQVTALAGTGAFTEEMYEMLLSRRDMLALDKEILKTTKEQEEAQKKVNEERQGGQIATEESLKVLSSAAEKLEGLKALKGNIFDDKFAKNAKTLSTKSLELFGILRNIKSLGAVNTVIAELQNVRETTGHFKTQEQLRKDILKTSEKTVFQLAKSKRIMQLFNEQVAPVKDAMGEIKGLVDNMPKSINTMRKSIRRMLLDMDEYLRKRREAVAEDARARAEDKKFASRSDNANNAYDRSLREAENALGAGSDAYKAYEDRIEGMRKKRLEEIATAKKVAQTERQAQVARENATAAIDKMNTAQDELVGLQNKINSLKNEEDLTTDANRKQLLSLRESYDELFQSLNSYRDGAAKAVQDLGKIQDVKPRWPGDLQGELIVSRQEVENFGKALADSVSGQADTIDGIKDAFIDLQVTADKSITKQAGKISAEVNKYKEELKGFTDSLTEGGRESVTALLGYFTQLFAKVEGDFAATADRVNAIINSLPGGGDFLTQLGKDGTGQNLFNEEKIQTQLDIVNKKEFYDVGRRAGELFGEEAQKGVDELRRQFQGIEMTPDLTYMKEQLNGLRKNYFKENPMEADILATVKITNLDDLRNALNINIKGGKTEADNNASGGFIRGKGTGTSDSILSWLSNGEYVVRASAVKHYGPWLLEAINRKLLPRFATGGMVSPSIANDFNLSGLAGAASGGGTPVVINMPGGGSYLLSGKSEEVSRLRRDMTIEVLRRGDIR